MSRSAITNPRYVEDITGVNFRWPREVTKVVNEIYNRNSVYLEWFGGGPLKTATENDAALDLAKLEYLPIYISPGTWQFASSHTLTDVPLIYGVPGFSILKPTSAVTTTGFIFNNGTTLTEPTIVGYNQPTRIYGLNFNGTAATSATGIEVGSTGTSANTIMDSCQIYGFNIGLNLGDIVNCLVENTVVSKCGTGIVIDATDTNLPTTTTIRKCRIGESDGVGISILSTHYTSILDTILESNGEEAINAATSATKDVYMVNIEKCWIEDSYSGDAGQASEYDIVADGSAGSTLTMVIRDTYFNSDAKSINFNTVNDFVFDNIRPRNAAGTVSINTAGQGHIVNWPHNNFDLRSCVVIDDALKVRVDQGYDFVAFSDGDATPNIDLATRFVTANTNPTTITDLDGGYDGQQVIIMFSDTNTTIDFTGTNLHGNGGADWTPAVYDSMTCTKYGTTHWLCDISDNSA